ncbi:hypothetical protein ACIQF5_21700 [Streptomyces goshikiensis]|uniref:hypothetical protein n=1 Tax=Streptomyces goshikiensis TaxID=1942 RepID=UPI0038135F7E
MRTYATAQHTGTDPGQCDATAVRTINGTRAYVLLDGLGRRLETHQWALGAARQIASAAARRGDAEARLRYVYNLHQEDAAHYGSEHKAAAVVAVKAPGKPLTVAWCGDSRAYLMERGIAVRLTEDHNKRRVYPPPPPPIRTAATATTSPRSSAPTPPTRTGSAGTATPRSRPRAARSSAPAACCSPRTAHTSPTRTPGTACSPSVTATT